jgi:hypothetical protein
MANAGTQINVTGYHNEPNVGSKTTESAKPDLNSTALKDSNERVKPNDSGLEESNPRDLTNFMIQS